MQEAKFDDASQWLFEGWISRLAQGGGAKKRFQYGMNQNSSNQFLYLRATQGHSGECAIDLALQDQFSDSEMICGVHLSCRERE